MICFDLEIYSCNYSARKCEKLERHFCVQEWLPVLLNRHDVFRRKDFCLAWIGLAWLGYQTGIDAQAESKDTGEHGLQSRISQAVGNTESVPPGDVQRENEHI